MFRKNVSVESRSVSFRRLPAILLATALMVPSLTACRNRETGPSRSVTVSAPANGIVRRVVVDSNVSVDKDAAIIEIAVQPAQARPVSPTNTSAIEAEVARAQTDLASAEGDANRSADELKRIEPLVKRGLASQAELDKARSQSLDAQEWLRLARVKANNATADRNRTASIAANEEILVVRAPSAGTVQAVNVHAGEAVVSGQPIVTLVSNT